MARVLLVEDDKITSMILARGLSKAGHEVEVAEQGLEAIEQLAGSDFAVVVTDLMMPKMSGEQLCYAIRNELGLAELPILVTTGVVDPSRLAWIEQAAPAHLVEKPVQLADLIARIEVITSA